MGLVFFLQDQFGKVPLYWGITADGYVAFADNIDLLKGACGKSLASFPQGGCDKNYNTICESSLSHVDQLPLIDCSCRSIISLSAIATT
jgi:asparagine synthetase B (glutamine-hydrolysing)